MLEDFLSYIVEELSVNKTDKILLAVSGGVDSMVMVDLFKRSEYYFEVAHINHSTRNGASDIDEKFVKDYCLSIDIPFHSIKLDYKTLSKGNFQQNAREARYNFFDSIMMIKKLNLLATAHHMDDRWETFVMNLNRKSGLRGLTSLKPRRNHIIRPLLNTRKKSIEAYASKNKIQYTEDISNSSDDYTRNKIRHHLSPVAEEVIPSIIQSANASISNIEKSQLLIQELIESSKLVVENKSTGFIHIDLQVIKTFKSKSELAFEIFGRYGYTMSTVSDLLETEMTGAIFLSSTHEALYNRGKVILRRQEDSISVNLRLSQKGVYKLQDGRTVVFDCAPVDRPKSGIVYIDSTKYENKIITLRSILPGDRYHPAHMKGKSKLVKKHLNDLKIDRFSKAKVLVIEINQKIVDIIT